MADLGTLWGASPLQADDASRLLFTVDTDLQTLTRALDDTPADFQSMDGVSWEVQWRANLNSGGAVDDSLGLDVRVMNGATVLAAADSGGGWVTVKTLSGTFTTTDTTVGPTVAGTPADATSATSGAATAATLTVAGTPSGATSATLAAATTDGSVPLGDTRLSASSPAQSLSASGPQDALLASSPSQTLVGAGSTSTLEATAP